MINRSEKYQYFQSKALHYHNLRNMKSKIDSSEPFTRQISLKLHKAPPYMRQHSIQVENKHLIKRLLNIAGTNHPQVTNQGYSKFFNIDRPFRKRNPFKQEVDRQNSIDNKKRNMRIVKLKPAIGSTQQWDSNYYRYKRYKNNLSSFRSSHKPRNSLCLSTDKFIPKQIKDFGIQQKDSNLKGSRIVTIPNERLFVLPSFKLHRYTQWSIDKDDQL